MTLGLISRCRRFKLISTKFQRCNDVVCPMGSLSQDLSKLIQLWTTISNTNYTAGDMSTHWLQVLRPQSRLHKLMQDKKSCFQETVLNVRLHTILQTVKLNTYFWYKIAKSRGSIFIVIKNIYSDTFPTYLYTVLTS